MLKNDHVKMALAAAPFSRFVVFQNSGSCRAGSLTEIQLTRIHATSSLFYFDRRKRHFFLFRAEEDAVITIDLEKVNTSSARNNKKSNFLCSKQILFENIWYDPFQDSVSLRKSHAKRLLDRMPALAKYITTTEKSYMALPRPRTKYQGD